MHTVSLFLASDDPIFGPLINWLSEFLLGAIIDAINTVLYGGLRSIAGVFLYLSEQMQRFIYILSGQSEAAYGDGTASLLEILMDSSSIHLLARIFFVLAAGVLVMTTLVAVIRNIYLGKKSMGAVIGQSVGSFVLMTLITAMFFAGMATANTLLRAVTAAFTEVNPGSSSMALEIIKLFKNDIYLSKNEALGAFVVLVGDVTTGFGESILLLIAAIVLFCILGMACLGLIRRLYDIILLYLIAPFVVTTVPLDGGARFKLWRDMVVSKMFSAYGTIFAFNIFFIMIPIINNLNFFGSNHFSNQLLRVVLIIGGAASISGAQQIISQVFGAGNNEGAQMLQSLRTLYYGGSVISRAGRNVISSSKRFFSGNQSGSSSSSSKSIFASSSSASGEAAGGVIAASNPVGVAFRAAKIGSTAVTKTMQLSAAMSGSSARISSSNISSANARSSNTSSANTRSSNISSANARSNNSMLSGNSKDFSNKATLGTNSKITAGATSAPSTNSSNLHIGSPRSSAANTSNINISNTSIIGNNSRNSNVTTSSQTALDGISQIISGVQGSELQENESTSERLKRHSGSKLGGTKQEGSFRKKR